MTPRGEGQKLYLHRCDRPVTVRISMPTTSYTPENELLDEAEKLANLLADSLPLVTFNALAFIIHKMVSS